MRTTNTTRQSGRRAVERRGKRAWALIGLAAAALLGLGLLGLLAATPAFAQQPATSDASLSGLELSGYTGEQQPKPVIALRPAFDAATLSYGASAAYTRQVRLRATANQAGASITVDGQTVASGAYSQAFTLRDNQPKRIELRVTAPDGATERVYALTATNNPAADLRDLSLSPVELHPSTFATSQQAYTAYAAYSVDAVRVTAIRRHGVETLTVNGQQVTSGQASDPIALELGANLITVVATAPDQYTSKSYSITVTRATEAQSSDATLSGISVYQATSFQPDNGNNVPYEGEPLPLTPAVSSTVREYQAEKAEKAGQSDANDWYVAVAVTTNAPGAKSIVVDGPDVNLERRDPKDEVVSGEASGPWQIALGYRLITITVTSLDGKSTETYRLVIKYGTLDELPGLRLSSGDGSLTVGWEASDSPTASTHYQLRWRKAGETTWLNRGFPAGWKTSYALDAADAGPADGHGYFPVSQGSATLSGLENGVAYEVHVRGARGSLSPRTGERKVFVFLRNDWRSLSGTPGQTRTALAISPSSPSREYGGVDDLSYTVSGLLDGDAAVDVLTGGLSRAAGADVGRYAIGMGTLAVANDYAAKYELASAPTTAIYEITPRPIPSISGVTVKERDADGTTTASFDTSAAVGTDVLAAELADFRAGGLQVTGSFPTAAAGRHNLAVTYALRDQGSFKAANYSLTQTTGALQGELTAPPTCADGLMLFADGVPAEGGAPVTVTVGLSSPAGVGGAIVTLTASGTAGGDDYTLSSTTVAIAEGATAGTATITVIDDALDDDDETIVLNAALTGSNLTAGPLTLTIADNDAPAPEADESCPDLKDGGLNPDDQRAPWPCAAGATPQSQRMFVTAHIDDDAAGFDEMAVLSIDLPQGVTMTPAFRSDHYSYELTVPDDTDGLTFAGIFDPESERVKGCCIPKHVAFAVLLVGDMAPADAEARWLGPDTNRPLAYPTIEQMIVANSGGLDANSQSMHGQTNRVELPLNATTAIYVSLYKTPLGNPHAFVNPSKAQALKRRLVYTLTVTRGDPSAGDAEQSAPTVALPIADVTGLAAGATRDISLSGVFSDADGDSLTITAASSDEAKATVTVAADDSKLTVAGVAVGTATITVTAEDADGERVSDTFQVAVQKRYAALIAQVVEWRNHPNGVNNQSHTDRWDRALLALGETVADTSLTPMTTAEAEQMAAQHMATRWNPVVAALREIEAAGQRQTPANQPPTVASAINDLSGLKPGARRTVSLSGVFSDADGDALTISARSSAVAVATVSVAGNGASLTVTGVALGAALITVTANDGRGGTVSDSFTVTTVAANTPPTLVSLLGDISGLKPGASRTVSLAGVFRDPNGDSLTMTARSTDESVATVSVAADGTSLTVTGVSGGTATITVSADDGDGATALDSFTVEVDLANAKATLAAVNAAPTLASALSDLSGLTPGASRQVSLAGVFQDADGDALTIAAQSSAAAVATVSVASGGASLTVTAVAKGTATITVTANDGNGGSVSDSFTVTVEAANAAPRVASAIGDLSGLKLGDTRQVLLSNVFQDADGDSLTITAQSSAAAVARVGVASGGASLTVTAVAKGTATISVSADDGKGGTVSDRFTVTITGNAAPRAVRSMDDVNGLTPQTTRRVLVADHFRDADNDPLTITAASSNDAVARVSVDGRNWSMTLSAVSAGTATITVTADDGQGGRASASFRVTVNAAPESEPEEQDSGLEGEPEQELVVQDVITRYDTNGDGEISLDEYNAAIPDLGTTLSFADLLKLRVAFQASSR